jgi:hypothetical protein
MVTTDGPPPEGRRYWVTREPLTTAERVVHRGNSGYCDDSACDCWTLPDPALHYTAGPPLAPSPPVVSPDTGREALALAGLHAHDCFDDDHAECRAIVRAVLAALSRSPERATAELSGFDATAHALGFAVPERATAGEGE